MNPSPPPKDDLHLVGKTLHDRYRIIKLIRTGGFGLVYLAEHLLLHDLVAIKFLSDEHAHTPSLVRQFLFEARAMAELKHPNIVGIRDVYEGIKDLPPHFVMEYMGRGSLHDRLKAGARFSPEETAVFLKKIAAALQLAHERGYVHRDIKPSNILFDDNDEPHLADFGIAKQLNPDPGSERTGTGTGQVKGSPQYMSPEQALGLTAIDARADQYSLGIVLYQMLSGGQVYLVNDGSTTLQTTARRLGTKVYQSYTEAHINGAPIDIAKWRDTLPAPLSTFFKRALAKKPEERFASMSAFAAAFEQAVRMRSAQNRRATVISGALLVLAITVIGALTLLTRSGGEDPPTSSAAPITATTAPTSASVVLLSTDTPIPTETNTAARTRTPRSSATPLPSETPTSTVIPTDTRVPTDSSTATPQPSDTPPPTATSTRTASPTPRPTETFTPTPLPSDTPTYTLTPSPRPTATRTPTTTPTEEPTLSLTQMELTVSAEYAAILAEITQTESANATAQIAALTATADAWTDTPTPDARQTALVRVTLDAAATAFSAQTATIGAGQRTEVALLRGTASAWMATQTAEAESSARANIIDVTPTDMTSAEATQPIVDVVSITEQLTIIERLSVEESASTFWAMIAVSGVAGVLSGDGQLTVFVPTNDAFEAYLESTGSTIEELISNENLSSIVMNHIFAGSMQAEALVALVRQESDGVFELASLVDGQSLRFSLDQAGQLLINEDTQIVLSDIGVPNGYIHLIQGILLPEFTVSEYNPFPEVTQSAIQRYVVEPGDTIQRIAARFGVTVPSLLASNKRLDPSRLYVGEVLIIPSSD